MRFLLFCLLLLSQAALAQTPETLRVRGYREKRERQILDEYLRFLSIPNLASDSGNMQRNAAFISEMMKARGIGGIQLLYPATRGIAPAVYGEVKVHGATKTLVFYAHYDGQPTDTTKWLTGLHPFRPVIMNGAAYQGAVPAELPVAGNPVNPEWRIYARGASDDKGGVISILNAYAALRDAGLTPGANLKFFFEGEEEAGSEHLYEILEKYKPLLQSDLWIICDGPVHQSGKKQVVFGVRGDTHLELTVYGPQRPLHSGHYGNWAPNPAMELVRLLSSMKNDSGKVTIAGFYDDVIPLSSAERKAIADIPSVDAQMKNELGFIQEETPGLGLGESINFPSLNINGMQSANVGRQSANVIPTKAVASMDLRLVAGNDYVKQQDKVIAHIRSQGFYVTEKEPTEDERKRYPKIIRVERSGGYNAQKTPMDLPVAKLVIDAVQSTTPEKVVLLPTGGGSLPLFVFEKYLNARTISVPIANHDNNQHAENENIRIRNLWEGMETMAALMRVVK